VVTLPFQPTGCGTSDDPPSVPPDAAWTRVGATVRETSTGGTLRAVASDPATDSDQAKAPDRGAELDREVEPDRAVDRERAVAVARPVAASGPIAVEGAVGRRPAFAPGAARWSRRWGSALIAGLAMIGAAQPGPDERPATQPVWADAASAASLGLLGVAIVALVAGRRWGAGPAAYGAAGLVALSALCPTWAHHQVGAWWVVQMVVSAVMLGGSVTMRSRSARTEAHGGIDAEFQAECVAIAGTDGDAAESGIGSVAGANRMSTVGARR